MVLFSAVKISRGLLAALAALLIAAPVAAAADDQPVSSPDAACISSDGGACDDGSGASVDGSQGGDSSNPGDSGSGADGGSSDSGDAGTGGKGDEEPPPAIDLCEWEPWNNPSCGGGDGDSTPPCKANPETGERICPIVDPIPDPPTVCDPETPNGSKVCFPVDPPDLCMVARFASQEAAEAAGCAGPGVDPGPIKVCATDKETGEKSCHPLQPGEYGCFETADGPWICIEPPYVPEPPCADGSTECAVEPPVEACYVDAEGTKTCPQAPECEKSDAGCVDGPPGEPGCFATPDGPVACYDLAPGGGDSGDPRVYNKDTTGHPKAPAPRGKGRSGHRGKPAPKVTAKARAKARAKAKARARAKAKARARAKAKARRKGPAKAQAKSGRGTRPAAKSRR